LVNPSSQGAPTTVRFFVRIFGEKSADTSPSSKRISIQVSLRHVLSTHATAGNSPSSATQTRLRRGGWSEFGSELPRVAALTKSRQKGSPRMELALPWHITSLVMVLARLANRPA
ncbi:unnamed protein product, partial [Ectocarpus sp. 12 AP-2014]